MITTFKATQEQLTQLMVNAINASSPAGMGYLHFKPGNITPEHFLKNASPRNHTYVDYWEGRMVKLMIHKAPEQEGAYAFYGDIRQDYQSWATEYPTYGDLLKSVGIIYDTVAE